MAEELQAGIYRHYKGHHYLVLGRAADSSIPGRSVVVYVGLELEGASPGPRMHVREYEEFFSWVSHKGKHRRRFTYVGPNWDG